jgi:hypothetical protein
VVKKKVFKKTTAESTYKEHGANYDTAKIMIRNRMRTDTGEDAANFFKTPYNNKHEVLKKVPLIFEYNSVYHTGADSFNHQANTR